MSSKQFIVKNFKKIFNEYIEFLEQNTKTQKYEVAYVKNVLSMLLKFNASQLIRVWFNYITIPYGKTIMEGNFDFFTEKNYKNDLKDLKDYDLNYILNTLEKSKQEAKELDEEKKKEMLLYNQNLTKLSILYFK